MFSKVSICLVFVTILFIQAICEIQLNGEVGGRRTLVILENMDMRFTHSLYFQHLKGLNMIPLP